MIFQLGSTLLDACVLAILDRGDTYGYVLTWIFQNPRCTRYCGVSRRITVLLHMTWLFRDVTGGITVLRMKAVSG